ncbi:MAG: PKD domain-containing protein, partial [Bacteroidetes bacterium]|nr:PKD domain-containing protein [Bacteroidota bacterium]
MMKKNLIVIGLLCFWGLLQGSAMHAQCGVTPAFNLSASTYCGVYPFSLGLANVSTGAGNDVATYRWFVNGNPHAVTTGLEPVPPVSITTHGAYTIRVEMTDTAATPCTAATTRSFTGRQLPAASFSYPAGALCGSNRVQFTNTSTNTAGGATYSWNFGHPGGTSSQQNPNHKFPNMGGTFTVTLTVTNPGGCSNVTSQTVTVGNAPDADFMGSGDGAQGTEFCFGAADPSTCIDVTFFNNSVDAVSYSWDFGDGSPASTDVQPTHRYNSTGSFTVTLTATGSGGCTDERQYTILYSKAPTGTFGFDAIGTSGCPPLMVQVTGLNNVSTLSTFNYRMRSGSATGAIVFSYDTNSPTDFPSFNLATPGEYYLELSATTACGAVNPLHRRSAFFGPIVVANTPIANFGYTLAGTTQEGTSPGNYLGRGCATNRISFTNSSQFAEPAATNHKWFFDRHPGDSLLGVRVPPPQLFTKGIYNVKLISGNSCGTDTIVRTIIIDTISVPDFNVIDPVGCVATPGGAYVAGLQNTSTDGGNTSYRWWRNDYCANCASCGSSFGCNSCYNINCHTNHMSPTEPPVAFRTFYSRSNYAVTTYSVWLEVVNGCGNPQVQKTVTVHPPVVSRPRVNGGTTPVQICEGQSVTFSDDSYGTPVSGPSMQYDWVFGNGNNASAGGSHSQSFANQGTYWAKLRVTGYCGTHL